ncbi:unnamed protein product [Gadus morhua 'NCC']
MGISEYKGTMTEDTPVRLLLILSDDSNTVDITIRRECIFKSLMIYLGEPVHHLIKECQDMQENEAAMAIVSGNEDIKSSLTEQRSSERCPQ